MEKLVIHPTDTSQWHELVHDAETLCATQLNEELESYLVFLLMRYAAQPEVTKSVIALDFLQSHQATGKERQLKLRDVGDKCLLLSGLFPGLAERKQVKVSYFVDVGQSAYTVLSEELNNALAKLFNGLSMEFVSMMDILQAMRSLDENSQQQLLPLQALELWNDTGSKQALHLLRQYTKANPIVIPNLKLS